MNSIKMLFVILPILCASCRNVSRVSTAVEDALVQKSIPKIFKSQNLQDTLCRFLTDVDSFPNPYGPPIYTIIYDKYQADSVLELYAYGLIMGDITIPGEIPLIPLGAFEHGGKIVAVNYNPILSKSVHSIVDSSMLHMNMYEKNMYTDGPYYEWDVAPSIRIYKLSNSDSLEVLYIKRSKYEDPSVGTYGRTVLNRL